MKKDDGGPAFPLPAFNNSDGLTLRDYFAGQAMVGLLANGNREGGMFSNKIINKKNGVERLADFSYEYADAMIKARGSE